MTCTLPNFLFGQEVRNLCGNEIFCALCVGGMEILSSLSIRAILTESIVGICELVYVAESVLRCLD